MVLYFKNLHVDLNDVVKLVQNTTGKSERIVNRGIAMAYDGVNAVRAAVRVPAVAQTQARAYVFAA